MKRVKTIHDANPEFALKLINCLSQADIKTGLMELLDELKENCHLLCRPVTNACPPIFMFIEASDLREIENKDGRLESLRHAIQAIFETGKCTSLPKPEWTSSAEQLHRQLQSMKVNDEISDIFKTAEYSPQANGVAHNFPSIKKTRIQL